MTTCLWRDVSLRFVFFRTEEHIFAYRCGLIYVRMNIVHVAELLLFSFCASPQLKLCLSCLSPSLWFRVEGPWPVCAARRVLLRPRFPGISEVFPWTKPRRLAWRSPRTASPSPPLTPTMLVPTSASPVQTVGQPSPAARRMLL